MELLILTLLIVGLALMVLEAFVPKLGILAVSGTVCFATALFALRGRDVFFNTPVSEWMLLGIAAVGMIVLAGSIYFIWRTANQNLPDPVIGQLARVVEWQGTTGRVHFEGDTWNAKADTVFAVGDMVYIAAFDPLAHLTVIVTHPKT